MSGDGEANTNNQQTGGNQPATFDSLLNQVASNQGKKRADAARAEASKVLDEKDALRRAKIAADLAHDQAVAACDTKLDELRKKFNLGLI